MRTLTEQYEYETRERGLDHATAIQQMSFMFTAEQLATLDPTQDGRNNEPVKITMNNEQTTTTTATDETTGTPATDQATDATGTATAPAAEKPKKTFVDVPPLTPEEREAVKAEIDALVEKAKEEAGGNPLKMPRLLDNAGGQFGGDEKFPKRIQMLCVLLDCQPADLMFNRCGPSALGQALSNYGIREPADTDLNIRKTVEESASELVLATETTGNGVTVSPRLKKMDTEETNVFQAASHAALHAAVRVLGEISKDKETGKPLPIPRQAVDFLSFLIGASNGSTDWFPATDGFIIQTSGMSKATIKRGRNALLDWQDATGRGLVSMRQASAPNPTLYKLDILSKTSTIIQNLLQGKTAQSAKLYAVADLAGKLLAGEAVKGVSDDDLANAKQIAVQLTEAVTGLTEPEIVRSEAATQATKSNTSKRLEKLRETIGSTLERTVDVADLAPLADRLNQLAVSVKDADATTVDEATLTGFENVLSATVIEVNDALATETQKAEAKAEAELEADGSVTPETRVSVAQAYVASLATTAYEVERDAAIEDALNAITRVFAIAAMSADADAAIGEAYTGIQEEAKTIATLISDAAKA